jgi:hypothetical protein
VSCATDATSDATKPGPVAPAAVVPATVKSSSTTTRTHSRASTAHKHRQKKSHHHRNKKHKQRAGSPCPPPSNVLLGIYHPDRLEVLAPCRHASGIVADIRDEEDGDFHVLVRLDAAYSHLVNRENKQQQHGWLVVELMPRDHGHLPAPYIGQHIGLLGAWVVDHDHGWNEMHPVWQETLSGRTYTSGPWAGGSPAYSGSSEALAGCRTGSGKKCTGYGGTSSDSGDGHGGSGGGGGGDKCTPGYSICLRPLSDYDCANGGGDGPGYVRREIRVTGSDPYSLDTDGDRRACETT